MTDEMKIQAQEIIDQDSEVKSDFWYCKFEKDACRNWDIFYKENKNNFFKDRQYLDKEFEELRQLGDDSTLTFCEFGCGVGNALLPLAKKYYNMKFIGFDFSKHAIDCLMNSREVKESKG